MKDLAVIAAVIIIAIAAIALIESTVITDEPDGTLELLEDDIFVYGDIDAAKITYNGIGLGADMEDVVSIMGPPDDQPAYQDGTVNLYYGQSLGYNKTVLIFHLENYTLTRMTFFSPLDETFVGDTRFQGGKRKVYDLLGIPQNQTSTSQNIWVYTYPDKGIDFLLYEKERFGMSLYE